MTKLASIVLGILGLLLGISALAGVILEGTSYRPYWGVLMAVLGISWLYRAFKLYNN